METLDPEEVPIWTRQNDGLTCLRKYLDKRKEGKKLKGYEAWEWPADAGNPTKKK